MGKAVFFNIFIERLWRTVKYEDIYLWNYETLKELREGLARYFKFYNSRRFHQSLGYKRPDEVYFQRNYERKVSEAERVIHISTVVNKERKKEAKKERKKYYDYHLIY